MKLKINGQDHDVQAEAYMPLLWVLRDILDMTGTKYGCGIAACGSCTVHVDGIATRSCTLPISAVEGKDIRTIEGIGAETMSVVQNAWIEHQVPQCGYCQSGMIMAVDALLEEIPDPNDQEIDEKITNICRCGTYQRVRAAIKSAAKNRQEEMSQTSLPTSN